MNGYWDLDQPRRQFHMVKDKTGDLRRPLPADGTGPETLFLVERSLVDLTSDGLLAVHRALAESCRRLSMGGRTVQYQRSFFALERGWCLSVFTASDRKTVGLANDVAQVPFVRIEEALNLDNLDP